MGLAIAFNLTSVFPVTAAAIALLGVNHAQVSSLPVQGPVGPLRRSGYSHSLRFSGDSSFQSPSRRFLLRGSSLTDMIDDLADTSFSLVFRDLGTLPSIF